jgi:uncharacterized protein (DUF2141 family)
MRARRVLALLALWAGAARAAGSGDMVVDIGPLRSAQGQVIVAVYDNNDGFPLDLTKAKLLRRVPVVGGKVELSFEGLPFGSYAVAAIHDENQNNTLDTYFLGVPREGVACSNDAHGRFGPPSFKDATFLFQAAGQVVTLKMVYL